MSNIFDNYTPDAEAKSTFDSLDPGTYNFKIKSMDGHNCVLTDTASGKSQWVKIFDGTEDQLRKVFDLADNIWEGKTATLEVYTNKAGYATVKLPYILPEPGNYRVKIKEVTASKNKNMNDMLTVVLELSGSTQTVRHWLTIPKDTEDQQTKDMRWGIINSFLDSFEGLDFTVDQNLWAGRVAGAKIGHQTGEYQGKPTENAVVKKWLAIDEQRNLPAWGGGAAQEATDTSLDDDFVPFDQ